jgi:AraC-like DNA-binding protein
LIPPKIDIFALLIFLGIVQGFYLSYFFLTNKQGNQLADRFYGLILVGFSCALLEILLCYTNYMFQVIWLIDFAEPTNFLFAPALYLYICSYLYQPFRKSDWWHLAPFFIYLMYKLITFHSLDEAAKYNAYINGYHLGLPEKAYHSPFPNWVYTLQSFVNELMLLQMCIYTMVMYVFLRKEFKKEQVSWWSNQNEALKWCRRIWLSFGSIIIIFVLVKLSFKNDLGDYIIATHMTLIIYSMSFVLTRKSSFFNQKPVKKYEKSSLTDEIQENTLQKLYALMQAEKPYLNSNFSLPSLAKNLSVSPHHLSQILNESLNQTFYDFAADYRINEAKVILNSKQFAHLKIEEIAEMVGYNSKSSFNTSFKKITGKTPSEFRSS